MLRGKTGFTSMTELPAFIDPEIWAAFLERREATKKQHPFTPKAQALMIGRITKMHAEGWDMNEALGTAAINGWLTVYPKIKRDGHDLEAIRQREKAAYAVQINQSIARMVAGAVKKVNQ